MRRLWIAVLGVGMMLPAGAVVAQLPHASAEQGMSRADRRAERKTEKAEAKAARNNAKAAREQVRAEERRGRAESGGRKMRALAVALTPPPM